MEDGYLNMDLLRFTTAGSVDDGKSTLIGRLLYDSKSIFEDQLEAVELASKQPVAGIVLQGAFVSAYRVMTRIPLFPGDKFENLAKMAALRNPVMIIHGTADDTVPSWHGEKLYDAIPGRKAKLFVEGGPHGGLADFTGPRYWEALRKFTDSL